MIIHAIDFVNYIMILAATPRNQNSGIGKEGHLVGVVFFICDIKRIVPAGIDVIKAKVG